MFQTLLMELNFQNNLCLHVFKDLEEFLYIVETLTISLTEKKQRLNIFEKCIPKMYKSLFTKFLRKIRKNKLDNKFPSLITRLIQS